MEEFEESSNPHLTLEEIMCLSEEDLIEMGTTRQELMDLINDHQIDSTSDNESQELEIIDELASDEEIEVEIDDSGLESLEMEQVVQVNVEDLPFLSEIYLENMMNWSWDEHLNPTIREESNRNTSSNQPIILPAGLSKKNRLKKEKKLKEDPNKITRIQHVPKVFHHPMSFWENYSDIITKRFKTCNRSLIDIKCIVNERLLDRFTNAIISEQQRLGTSVTHRIFLCFHGTASINIPSIIENGLLVPGKNNNLAVINGSALGVGIYVTVMDPQISIGYCVGGNQLFACAVLLSDTVNTKNHGNVLVIYEEKFILPCFLVTVRGAIDTKSTETSENDTLIEEEKKRLTKKGEVVFSKKKKEEEREKIRKKKNEKAIKQNAGTFY